jgi:iron complex outermembrane receptor protein
VLLSAGVRADAVRFEVRDHLLNASTRDDSGARTLHAVSPAAGIVWRASQLSSLYASVSSSFETPTTTELGNKPDGSAGINPDLQPQRTLTLEIGTKGILPLVGVHWDAALFEARARDELVPFDIPGGQGRRYFRNAGRTLRRGGELGMQADAGPLSLQTSYTYSRFRYADYAVSGTSYAGNRIPGIPVHALAAEASLRRGAITFSTTADAASGMFIDDANSTETPGRVIFGAAMAGRVRAGDAELSPMIAVQNLGDVHYVGSVSVNATGGKFYEPAPGRALVLRLSVSRAP